MAGDYSRAAGGASQGSSGQVDLRSWTANQIAAFSHQLLIAVLTHLRSEQIIRVYGVA
jgi:hypothetical protein